MYKNCKTEASQKRQRAMEEALLLAMEQIPYDRITLNRLCKDLNIPRKSLYRYFPTKEDILLGLLDHRLSDCNVRVFSDWDGNMWFDKTNLVQFFSFWLEEKRFLDVIMKHGFWPLLLERTTCIVDAMKKRGHDSGEQSFAREQVEYFIAHGLMATVLRWHHMDYLSPPEEMAEMFASVLCSPYISISRLM